MIPSSNRLSVFLRGGLLALSVASQMVAYSPAVQAGDDPAVRKQWWPSKWGADDRIGAANLLTPEKVMAAAGLITDGKIYDLGRVFEEDMPLFDLTPESRKYTLVVPGGPSYGPMGKNGLAWNEDYISGQITQDGTQFDALSHMATVLKTPDGKEVRYYNGLKHEDIATGRGFKELGAEVAPPFFTRGILMDIAGLKGERLASGYEITIADLKAALKRQGLTEDDIKPGDAVFYYTGWGELWKTDNATFNKSVAGLSPEAGDWLVEKQVVLVGTDNWGVEAIPGANPDLFAPNHQKFLVENGIYIMENMDFQPLIDAAVWEFAFIYSPIKFKGATGSPARPIAVK